MRPRRVEVVHVGSAARDVAEDDPRGWRLGGGVTYAALTTARLGLHTAAIVGVDHDARDARELDALRAAGVDLLVVDLPEGPVFDNRETAAGRVQTAIRVGVPLEPRSLPESWLAAAAWSLVPVAGEVGDAWTTVIPPEAVVAVGWQGLLRRLVAGERVERVAPTTRALLQRADLVGVSHHDVDAAMPLVDLAAMLRPGARLLVTQGEHGGLLVTAGPKGTERPLQVVRYLPTHTDGEVDPTGAGDTFLAALVAATVRPSMLGPGRGRFGADLRFAAAAGSLAVEGVGLGGVPDLAAVTRRRVRERVRRAVLPSEASQVGAADPIELAEVASSRR
jgi:sugar/nucleoside kinase (ribokinase family)